MCNDKPLWDVPDDLHDLAIKAGYREPLTCEQKHKNCFVINVLLAGTFAYVVFGIACAASFIISGINRTFTFNELMDQWLFSLLFFFFGLSALVLIDHKNEQEDANGK